MQIIRPSMPMNPKLVEVLGFIGLIVFLEVILFILFHDKGFLYKEAGWVRHFGLKIAAGEIPYKDFFIPITPLSYFLSALNIKLFGSSFFGDAIYLLFIRIIFTLMLFYVFFHFYKSIFYSFLTAVAVSAIYNMLAMQMWYQWYDEDAILISLAIFLVAMNLTKRSLETEVRSQFLLGFLVGCAFLTKQTYGFLLLVGVLLLVCGYWPRKFDAILRILIGVFVTIGIFVSYLIYFDALSDAFNNIFILAPSLKGGAEGILSRILFLGPSYHPAYCIAGSLLVLVLVISFRKSMDSIFQSSLLILIFITYILTLVYYLPANTAYVQKLWMFREFLLGSAAFAGVYGAMITAILLLLKKITMNQFILFFIFGSIVNLAQKLSGWNNGSIFILASGCIVVFTSLLYLSKQIATKANIGSYVSTVFGVAFVSSVIYLCFDFRSKTTFYHDLDKSLDYPELSHLKVNSSIYDYFSKIELLINENLKLENDYLLFIPSAPFMYDVLGYSSPSREFDIFYPDFIPAAKYISVLGEISLNPPKLVFYDEQNNLNTEFYLAFNMFLEENYTILERTKNSYGRWTKIYSLN